MTSRLRAFRPLAGWTCLCVLVPAAVSAQAPGECAASVDPEPHPVALDAVLDSARLVGGLPEIWQAEWGRALASMGVDPTGAVSEPRVHIRSEDSDAERDLGAWLGTLTRSPAPSDLEGPFWVLLGDADGPSPRTLGDVTVCAPLMTNQDRITELLREKGRALENRMTSRSVVEVFVEEDGTVSRTAFREHPGFPDHARAVLEVARAFRFRPAHIEGIPTSVWTRVPLTLEVR